MKTVYLNNGASSFPKAPGVIEALIAELEKPPFNPGRTGFNRINPLEKCRTLISKMINTGDPSRVILTSGSTCSLNLAISGFPFNKGDLAVTTAAAHNSVLRPLRYAVKRKGIRLEILPVDEEGRVRHKDFTELLKKETPRFLVLNHASNVTGAVADVKSIFTSAVEKGAVTLLDASQTFGILPFDVKDLKADMAAFPGHKSVHGPPGTGVLYVAGGLEIEPIITGGTGVLSDLPLQPSDYPMHLEAGTPNIPAFAGLAAALEWHGEIEDSLTKPLELVSKLEKGLEDVKGVRVVKVRGERIPTLSFLIEGQDPGETAYVLEKSFGIICRGGLHCAPLIHKYTGSEKRGTVRFCPSIFTKADEIEYAVESVRKVVSL